MQFQNIIMVYFSIIIPLYNKEKSIEKTLKSVLEQTFQNFEIIIVNDGSTDSSERTARKIMDDRIKIFSIKNQGVSFARNYGANKAQSNLIVLLDADDYWKPNHLENLKALHTLFPNSGMYATAYESQFGEKIIAADYYKIPKQSGWSGIVEDFFESSYVNCIASSSSVMIPKKVYDDLGGFNSIYNSGEDTDLWIRIALHHHIAFINQSSVIINMLAENQASKKSIHTKNHLNFDSFEQEANNPSLKKYLDLNRFSIAIQHKLEGNNLKANILISKINMGNLNAKQRLLLTMNMTSLKTMLRLKDALRKNGIGLSAFR